MTEETFEYSLAALPAYLNIFAYFKTEQNQPCAYSGTFEVRTQRRAKQWPLKTSHKRDKAPWYYAISQGKKSEWILLIK